MSDFASTLAGLGDALGALAKRAEEIDQNLSRQFAELESQAAAMRSILHRIGLNEKTSALWALVHRDINLALSGDAGLNWVPREELDMAVQVGRGHVLARVGKEVAEMYAATAGKGTAAEAFVAVLELINRLDTGP